MNNKKKYSSKAYAYTPGLKVKSFEVVRKTRLLPLPGDIVVELGSYVGFDTIVAETKVPGDPHIIKASSLLAIEPEELSNYLVKKEGDLVEKNEILAKYSAFFGLSKRVVTSPVKGYVETISNSTGRVIVREPETNLLIKAYIPGRVVEIMPYEGVIIETTAVFIQGIFGIGGETHGPLSIAVDSSDELLTHSKIKDEHLGKILVGGSKIDYSALKKALEVGVKGIIVGGIDDDDLSKFMGYDIGVALTGSENLGLTLIVTEGFGKISMSQKTFEILNDYDKLEVALNGATQIRAGVLRPEIIIPHRENVEAPIKSKSLDIGMVPGTKVRIIREPFFGRIGKILSLPINLQRLESGSRVRVLEVELDNEICVTVPRANVEIIEE